MPKKSNPSPFRILGQDIGLELLKDPDEFGKKASIDTESRKKRVQLNYETPDSITVTYNSIESRIALPASTIAKKLSRQFHGTTMTSEPITTSEAVKQEYQRSYKNGERSNTDWRGNPDPNRKHEGNEGNEGNNGNSNPPIPPTFEHTPYENPLKINKDEKPEPFYKITQEETKKKTRNLPEIEEETIGTPDDELGI